jgi:serine/threonine-protein phosphatase 2A regulatory subunit A
VEVAAMLKDGDIQVIIDAISKLILDEDPLVRLRILKKIEIIAADLPAFCLKLIESLKRMFRDSNWRVRKQIASAMPSVAKHLGGEIFSQNFLNDILLLLKDGVDEVRLESARILPLLVSSSNPSWMSESILPSIKSLSNEDFLVRLCMLTALEGLFHLDLSESQLTEILDSIIAASKDKVPNIRIRCVQILGRIIFHSKNDQTRILIRTVIQDLTADNDKDVKYFASVSLKSSLKN